MNIRVEDNNLIPYNDWLTGNTTIYNGSYTATNFGTVTQIVEYDEDPFGNTGIVWTHNTISPLSRNGFNTAIVNVDINYNYRYSCWVKSSGVTSAYFRLYGRVNGTVSGLTNITTGAFNANSDCFAQVPYNYSDDEWYLWVGYVRSYTTTGTTSLNESGLYSTNGTKLVNFTDWKFLSNINGTSYRLYIPYNTSGTTVQFIYPRIDKCDGTEPSINTLLQNEGMWRSGTTFIKVEDNNLLDYSDWINNITGSTLMFNNNGRTFSKNYIEINNDPFNNNNYVWNSTIQSGATAHSSAGWNTDNIIIEPGVNYRYSQWVKRKNNSVSRVYFGCAAYGSDNNPRYLKYAKNGFIDTGYGGPMYNVNFTSSAWLPNEEWVLINYAILNSGSTTGSTLYNTGIWNSGGTKTTAIFNDMIMTSGTTQIQLRYFGPYVVTTGAAHFQASYPRFDILDGTEPSINTLLQNEGMWRSGTTMIYIDDTWKNTLPTTTTSTTAPVTTTTSTTTPVTTTTSTTVPTLLTYPGSTHTEKDVIDLGGTVWTIPSGEYSGKTIGVFLQDWNHASLDIPSGWSIATGNGGRYYEVRFPCTFTDYCSHEFASYSSPTGFGLWPDTQQGYGGNTYHGQYVNCTQANEYAPGYWIIYYSNSPYFVRALDVITWILGTNSTQGHAGHEIYSFGAY